MPPRKSAIKAEDSGVTIQLRVQPKASRNAISIEPDGRIRVALTAPPVDGKANKALLAFLADALSIPKRTVSLVRGETSREKTVRVDGLDRETVCSRLGISGDNASQGAVS